MSEWVTGPDVSDFQGDINWRDVAADGHSFAIAKATEGVTWIGKTFARNWRGIAEQGLVRGAYHYGRWEWDRAKKEAEHFVRTVGELRDSDFNPFLDVEWNKAYKNKAGVEDPAQKAAIKARTRAQIVEWCEEWIDRVHDLTDRWSIIYSGPSFIRYRLQPDCPRCRGEETIKLGGKRVECPTCRGTGSDGKFSLNDYDLWIADYDAAKPNTKSWNSWAFWQITGKGTVKGIVGKVDINRFNGAVEDLAHYTNLK